MISTSIHNVKKTAAVVFAGIAIAISLTACGTGGEQTGGADGLAVDNQEAAFTDWRIKFDACLKDQGVEVQSLQTSMNSGDSESDGGSGTGGGETGAATLDMSGVDMDEFQKAYDSCLDKVGEPPVDPNMPSPEEMNEQMLAFAKCMRDAGYDFPDPEPVSGNGVAPAMRLGGDDVDPAVMEKCSSDAGMGGNSK